MPLGESPRKRLRPEGKKTLDEYLEQPGPAAASVASIRAGRPKRRAVRDTAGSGSEGAPS